MWISLFIGVFLGLFMFIHGPMYCWGSHGSFPLDLYAFLHVFVVIRVIKSLLSLFVSFVACFCFPVVICRRLKKGKNRKTLRARFSVSETWINLSTAHFLDILCTVRTGHCRHADWTGALSGRVIRYTMRATIGRGVRVGSGRTPVSPWLRKTPFWGDSER